VCVLLKRNFNQNNVNACCSEISKCMWKCVQKRLCSLEIEKKITARNFANHLWNMRLVTVSSSYKTFFFFFRLCSRFSFFGSKTASNSEKTAFSRSRVNANASMYDFHILNECLLSQHQAI